MMRRTLSKERVMSDERTTLGDAQSRLEAIYSDLDIAEETRRRLAQPALTLQVSIPVRMDNGSLQVFQGWRVQYDDTRGPAKGGSAFIQTLPRTR